MTTTERLRAVRARVEEAAAHAGRPGGVALIAVSKTVSATAIQEAYEAGQRVFGENRVQEAAAKITELRATLPEAQWHLIGHLQSNKVRLAVGVFHCIQSIDSVKLATAVHTRAHEGGTSPLPVLLEVNVAHEDAKSGFHPDLLLEVAGRLAGLGQLRIDGLMTVAPLATDPEDVRWAFRRLRELRDELQLRPGFEHCRELSMGMSGDFIVAIEEGATMVRVGRAIFGDRATPEGRAKL